MRTTAFVSAAVVAVAAALLVSLTPAQADTKKRADTKKKQANTGEIHVVLTGFRNNKGFVRIAIFLDKKGFPKKKMQAYGRRSAKIKKNKATIVLKNVPAGDFAIVGLHDEDEDGEMKMSFGLPREGYFITRNPSFKLRAPKFREAKLVLQPGQVLKVSPKMKYL